MWDLYIVDILERENFRVYNVGVIFFHAILEWLRNCDVKRNSVQRVVKVSCI